MGSRGLDLELPVAPENHPWMWATGHNGDIRRAAHGYEPTREAAMAAFAKSWRLGRYASGAAARQCLSMFKRVGPYCCSEGLRGLRL
jgi:hypothetical protein